VKPLPLSVAGRESSHSPESCHPRCPPCRAVRLCRRLSPLDDPLVELSVFSTRCRSKSRPNPCPGTHFRVFSGEAPPYAAARGHLCRPRVVASAEAAANRSILTRQPRSSQLANIPVNPRRTALLLLNSSSIFLLLQLDPPMI
jgi:hypothetical protein